MTINIKDLSDEQIDKLVALAQGWHTTVSSNLLWGTPDGAFRAKRGYHPSTDAGQCFELAIATKTAWWPIDEYGYEAEVDYTLVKTYEPRVAVHSDPLKAVCLAVIASVFGNEVDVENPVRLAE